MSTLSSACCQRVAPVHIIRIRVVCSIVRASLRLGARFGLLSLGSAAARRLSLPSPHVIAEGHRLPDNLRSGRVQGMPVLESEERQVQDARNRVRAGPVIVGWHALPEGDRVCPPNSTDRNWHASRAPRRVSLILVTILLKCGVRIAHGSINHGSS